MLNTTEYDSLREYLVATIYDKISESNKDTQSLDTWKEVVGKVTLPNWLDCYLNLANLFYVCTPDQLADIYKEYRGEINELLIDYRTSLYDGATFDKVADERIGWVWDDYDPLILERHNQGLVARLASLIVAKQIASQLEQGTFIIPYSP